MKGLGGRGHGKPGRGKGKDKGKGKDSCAGVRSTYANPGRPKSFQPTHQHRKQTGNIAEYFRRSDTTPQPVAPVFASAQMRNGLEGSRPRASPVPCTFRLLRGWKVAPKVALFALSNVAERGIGSRGHASAVGPSHCDYWL